jgi:hypothetical protein
LEEANALHSSSLAEINHEIMLQITGVLTESSPLSLRQITGQNLNHHS